MRLVTVELCRAHDACYTDEQLRAVLGDGLPLKDLLRRKDVPAKDRVWAATELGLVDSHILRLFAVDCARSALLRERAEGRKPDPRSWAAVEVAERYARGEATDAELETAAGEAWEAVWGSSEMPLEGKAWMTARSAAWAAGPVSDAWGAVSDAWEAASWAASSWAASSSAESEQQVECLLRMVQQ